MKRIPIDEITLAVKSACIDINYQIDDRIMEAFKEGIETERSPIGIGIMNDLIQNAKLASQKIAPICQDTGMVVAFVTIGQSVIIEGGSCTEAIQAGIRAGYKEGFLRKSVVTDPLIRNNSGDNTPGIIYYDLVEGDTFEIELAAKGFGSENMSKSFMLKPSDGLEGVVDCVIETVKTAGSNPCPPIIVGVGIGGTLDKAAQIAKRALLRPLGDSHVMPHIVDLEKRLKREINTLGIGPQGLGGDTTALAVHVEVFPTHIAGLPVVVNINCHASRHHKITL